MTSALTDEEFSARMTSVGLEIALACQEAAVHAQRQQWHLAAKRVREAARVLGAAADEIEQRGRATRGPEVV